MPSALDQLNQPWVYFDVLGGSAARRASIPRNVLREG